MSQKLNFKIRFPKKKKTYHYNINLALLIKLKLCANREKTSVNFSNTNS